MYLLAPELVANGRTEKQTDRKTDRQTERQKDMDSLFIIIRIYSIVMALILFLRIPVTLFSGTHHVIPINVRLTQETIV